MRGRRLSIGWDGYSQNMEYDNMTVTVMCDILVTDLCNITL